MRHRTCLSCVTLGIQGGHQSLDARCQSRHAKEEPLSTCGVGGVYCLLGCRRCAASFSALVVQAPPPSCVMRLVLTIRPIRSGRGSS